MYAFDCWRGKSSFRYIQEFMLLDQNIFDLLIFMDIIYYSIRLVSCIW